MHSRIRGRVRPPPTGRACADRRVRHGAQARRAEALEIPGLKYTCIANFPASAFRSSHRMPENAQKRPLYTHSSVDPLCNVRIRSAICMGHGRAMDGAWPRGVGRSRWGPAPGPSCSSTSAEARALARRPRRRSAPVRSAHGRLHSEGVRACRQPFPSFLLS